jgi:hypothetical protein
VFSKEMLELLSPGGASEKAMILPSGDQSRGGHDGAPEYSLRSAPPSVLIRYIERSWPR